MSNKYIIFTFFVMSLCLFFPSATLFSQKSNERIITYTVEKTGTLKEITEKFYGKENLPLKDMSEFNGISANTKIEKSSQINVILKTETDPNNTQYFKYKIRSGDTLGSISKKFYGDSKRWKLIYDYNKGISDIAKIKYSRKSNFKIVLLQVDSILLIPFIEFKESADISFDKHFYRFDTEKTFLDNNFITIINHTNNSVNVKIKINSHNKICFIPHYFDKSSDELMLLPNQKKKILINFNLQKFHSDAEYFSLSTYIGNELQASAKGKLTINRRSPELDVKEIQTGNPAVKSFILTNDGSQISDLKLSGADENIKIVPNLDNINLNKGESVFFYVWVDKKILINTNYTSKIILSCGSDWKEEKEIFFDFNSSKVKLLENVTQIGTVLKKQMHYLSSLKQINTEFNYDLDLQKTNNATSQDIDRQISEHLQNGYIVDYFYPNTEQESRRYKIYTFRQKNDTTNGLIYATDYDEDGEIDKVVFRNGKNVVYVKIDNIWYESPAELVFLTIDFKNVSSKIPIRGLNLSIKTNGQEFFYERNFFIRGKNLFNIPLHLFAEKENHSENGINIQITVDNMFGNSFQIISNPTLYIKYANPVKTAVYPEEKDNYAILSSSKPDLAIYSNMISLKRNDKWQKISAKLYNLGGKKFNSDINFYSYYKNNSPIKLFSYKIYNLQGFDFDITSFENTNASNEDGCIVIADNLDRTEETNEKNNFAYTISRNSQNIVNDAQEHGIYQSLYSLINLYIEKRKSNIKIPKIDFDNFILEIIPISKEQDTEYINNLENEISYKMKLYQLANANSLTETDNEKSSLISDYSFYQIYVVPMSFVDYQNTIGPFDLSSDGKSECTFELSEFLFEKQFKFRYIVKDIDGNIVLIDDNIWNITLQ